MDIGDKIWLSLVIVAGIVGGCVTGMMGAVGIIVAQHMYAELANVPRWPFTYAPPILGACLILAALIFLILWIKDKFL